MYEICRNNALITELGTRGHNITVISPYSEPNPPLNVHYILLENNDEDANQKFAREILEATDSVNPFYEAFLIEEAIFAMCSGKITTYTSTNVKYS